MFSWFKKFVPPQHVINYIDALDSDTACKRFEMQGTDKIWTKVFFDTEGGPPITVKRGIDRRVEDIEDPDIFSYDEKYLILKAMCKWEDRYWLIRQTAKAHANAVEAERHMYEFIKSYE